MVEDGSLKLNVLLEEWQCLHFLLLFDVAGTVFWYRWDLLHVPDVTRLLKVLVAVDLGLLICPIRKRCGMGPHSYSGWSMNQLEMPSDTLELLPRLAVFELDFE